MYWYFKEILMIFLSLQASHIFLSPVNFNFKNYKFSYLLFRKLNLFLIYLISSIFFPKNILLVCLVNFLPKYSVSQKPLTGPLLFLIFIVVEQVQQQ